MRFTMVRLNPEASSAHNKCGGETLSTIRRYIYFEIRWFERYKSNSVLSCRPILGRALQRLCTPSARCDIHRLKIAFTVHVQRAPVDTSRVVLRFARRSGFVWIFPRCLDSPQKISQETALVNIDSVFKGMLRFFWELLLFCLLI